MAVKIEPKKVKATVTFTTQAKEDASQSILKGGWDDWKGRVMEKNADGTFSVEASIDLGKAYQFGYSIDGEWTPDADCPLVTSPFGTSNSVLDLTEAVAAKKSAAKPKAEKKPATRRKSTGSR